MIGWRAWCQLNFPEVRISEFLCLAASDTSGAGRLTERTPLKRLLNTIGDRHPLQIVPVTLDRACFLDHWVIS